MYITLAGVEARRQNVPSCGHHLRVDLTPSNEMPARLRPSELVFTVAHIVDVSIICMLYTQSLTLFAFSSFFDPFLYLNFLFA